MLHASEKVSYPANVAASQLQHTRLFRAQAHRKYSLMPNEKNSDDKTINDNFQKYLLTAARCFILQFIFLSQAGVLCLSACFLARFI
jgi:hypothetical protein